MVDERAPSVDLDNREQLAVASLERGVAADVDFLELEPELGPQTVERSARALTQMAP